MADVRCERGLRTPQALRLLKTLLRPTLAITLLALASTGCAPFKTYVRTIEISSFRCVDGCRFADVGVSSDGSSFVRIANDLRTQPAQLPDGDFQNALDALPTGAVIRCWHRNELGTPWDRVQITLTLVNGRMIFCNERAGRAGPVPTDENQIRTYALAEGGVLYEAAMAPRYAAIKNALRNNGVQSIQLVRTPCPHNCPEYTADFFRNSTADITILRRWGYLRARANIPFDQVRAAILAVGPSSLNPVFNVLPIGEPGGAISIVTPQETFATGQAALKNWNPRMRALFYRLDRLVRAATWSTQLPTDY